ncbi:MAG TPA: AAA family ATPase [Vicinamibacterales bacterium]|jgi:pilus assembly protein CpaE|nr:AAA family ATPase [Vicinamibacterales bacterium]
MAQLVALIVSEDDTFKKHFGRLLRAGAIPISVIDDRAGRDGATPDMMIVDARGDASSAMSNIERLRASAAGAGLFAVASVADPDLILQSMRAGANEFFAWPPDEETFHGAVRRTAARRETAQGARASATTLVFFGAKGGAGTTTVSVNCGVELARLSKKSTVIVDLKPGLGEVALFLGVRPRYSLLDAIDNLHRLDREFLKELVVKHKSGLEILAGSDQFDRPGGADGGALEELFRLLARQYEYILVDCGSQINSCTVAALYTADTIFLVANPDVPSIRNSQRLLDRVRQLGACGERVRVLLNRAQEPYPIPPKQIEGALGHPIHHTFPSDYKTVSTALNSGVPLALTGNSDIASQFDHFTRQILEANGAAVPAPASARRKLPGLERLTAGIASVW